MKQLIKVLLFTIIVMLNNSCKKSNNNIDVKKYLKSNFCSIDTSLLIADSIRIIDSDIELFDIILLGENHSVAYNNIVDEKLFKYLNTNFNINTYIQEFGYASSALINEFIQTGDVEILDFVFSQFKGTNSWNKETYMLWQNLYNYNSTLSNDSKIKLIGIDIEHQRGNAFYYLNFILPEKEIPNEIKSKIDTIKNCLKYLFNRPNGDIEFCMNLKRDMDENQSIYESYFQNNFFNFQIVVNNLINSINTYNAINDNNDQSDVIRETAIYSNFLAVYNKYGFVKCYGRFGLDHIYQSRTDLSGLQSESFASFLQSDTSIFQNKVLSIPIIYSNCERANRFNNYSPEPVNENVPDKDLLIESGNKQIYFYKLNNENSPFNEHLYFLPDKTSKVTTDYFQYAIKVIDSPASSPLE